MTHLVTRLRGLTCGRHHAATCRNYLVPGYEVLLIFRGQILPEIQRCLVPHSQVSLDIVFDAGACNVATLFSHASITTAIS